MTIYSLKFYFEGEAPILWPPDVKSWLIGKDPDTGKCWRQKEKGVTEDEMAGWHHWPNGHESEWTPGLGDGQGGLACCDSWGCKESDTTEWLIWSDGPLDCKEIEPVSPKGNQSWIFIGRTDAEVETQILWPPDMMNWLIGKDPDAGKDWRQEKGFICRCT